MNHHYILDLYECDQKKLNDKAYILKTIRKAIKAAKSTLLNLSHHKFDPQGVTAIALLAESHISIHTWPEKGYAAVDCFTCGSHTMPEVACEVIRKMLGSKLHKLQNIKRITEHSAECLSV
jgi:S-adenosylmethionine decarboxylase